MSKPIDMFYTNTSQLVKERNKEDDFILNENNTTVVSYVQFLVILILNLKSIIS